jgi:signal transduction histidine kinase
MHLLIKHQFFNNLRYRLYYLSKFEFNIFLQFCNTFFKLILIGAFSNEEKNNQLSEIKYMVDKILKELEKDITPHKGDLKTLLKTVKNLHIQPGLQNELIFKTTLYSIGDAVITTDKQSKIQNMNKVAENLLVGKKRMLKEKL